LAERVSQFAFGADHLEFPCLHLIFINPLSSRLNGSPLSVSYVRSKPSSRSLLLIRLKESPFSSLRHFLRLLPSFRGDNRLRIGLRVVRNELPA
jgi:hypothetical protein